MSTRLTCLGPTVLVRSRTASKVAAHRRQERRYSTRALPAANVASMRARRWLRIYLMVCAVVLGTLGQGRAASETLPTLNARLPLPRAARVSARARLWGRPRGRSGIDFNGDSSSAPIREDARVGAAKLWDGDELAAELDSESGPRGHVHYPGTFVPLLQIEQGEILVVVTDHVGAPRDLLGSDGTVRWSAAYTAWGKLQEEFVANAQNPRGPPVIRSPFRLLGQYFDEETGLAATRFRMWDAETGRWLSPDPLGVFGGENLFAFSGAPTTSVDPYGLSDEWR